MKKVIMSLGFAAATILGAQAQEVSPQDQETEQQTQTEDYNTQEEQDQGNTGTQDNELGSQDQKQGEFQSGDIKQINQAEIPQKVQDALKDSDFENASINQAYVVSGAAIEEIEADGVFQGVLGEEPEKLYQLQVTGEENKTGVVYITEEGEVYASEEHDTQNQGTTGTQGDHLGTQDQGTTGTQDQ